MKRLYRLGKSGVKVSASDALSTTATVAIAGGSAGVVGLSLYALGRFQGRRKAETVAAKPTPAQ